MDVNFDAISGLPNTYDYINNSSTGGGMLVVALFVLLSYYILFAALGAMTSETSATQGVGTGSSSNAIEVIMWSVFILLLIFNGLQYFFSINVNASLKNLFTRNPEVDLTIDMPYVKNKKKSGTDDKDETIKPSDSIEEITYEEQTFHIPGNQYTYNDAEAICKAYGSRLANYNDLEKTYKSGGEWCSYGWSDGQMALFPTQKDTWNTLQGIEGHENDCGRPGINGGYIANPNVRFGVNCFGYKPKITQQEQELMENTTLFPKTQKEIDFQNNVNKWKNKLPEVLVAPFNSTEWSKP